MLIATHRVALSLTGAAVCNVIVTVPLIKLVANPSRLYVTAEAAGLGLNVSPLGSGPRTRSGTSLVESVVPEPLMSLKTIQPASQLLVLVVLHAVPLDDGQRLTGCPRLIA